MCSIYGSLSWLGHPTKIDEISTLAADRGRDNHGRKVYTNGNRVAIIGSRRATPTTEVDEAPAQPYGNVVHNGTIANDKELGARPGEVDSMVLHRVLDFSGFRQFVKSLAKLKGSFALAAAANGTVYLACNYKPVYYYTTNGTTYFASMERHLAPVVKMGTRAARLRPYSALDLGTMEQADLPREGSQKALVVASAGLDSTVAAALLIEQGYQVSLLHFLYGTGADVVEAGRILDIGARLGAPVLMHQIDYQPMLGSGGLATGSLAGGVDGAEWAFEWVPARNLLMLATAVAYAEANGFGTVAYGGNLEEAGAYPDNEEEFVNLLDQALDYAVADGKQVRLVAPVGRLMKHEIVAEGLRLGAPLDLTWSCYRDEERHCGECGPCYMRRTAFERNGVSDPAFV